MIRLVCPELSVTADFATDNVARLRFTGTAETPIAPDVEKFLREVHAEAARRHVQQASVDLRQLRFMDSSCFKAFVDWIEEVRNCSEADRYRIAFLRSPNTHWQRRSLSALKAFGGDIVTVDES